MRVIVYFEVPWRRFKRSRRLNGGERESRSRSRSRGRSRGKSRIIGRDTMTFIRYIPWQETAS
eukprot:748328-Hanusia_phi.AAC.2